MKQTVLVVLTFMLTGSASGCGTLFNLNGKEPWVLGPPPERQTVPFGGIDNDVRWMTRGVPLMGAPLCVVAAAVDMPFSFVGDILTLPYTFLCAVTNTLELPPESKRRLMDERALAESK